MSAHHLFVTCAACSKTEQLPTDSLDLDGFDATDWEGEFITVPQCIDCKAEGRVAVTVGPVVLHHHDIESHAASFNEGYDTAVAQGMMDNPEDAADWLADDRAVQRIVALREAAAAIQALHPGEVKNSVIFLNQRADDLEAPLRPAPKLKIVSD